MIEYNPEGGNLGRADRTITRNEMYLVVPHVATCLQGFFDIKPGNYKYAFEVICNPEDREIFEHTLKHSILPNAVKWYQAQTGQRLFEIRSESGGVNTGHLICYLVTTFN